MKKISTTLIFFLFCTTLFSQTYLDVDPGYGTLNDAISTNQGNVIYRLQAGGWYTLNGVIENDGFPLSIIGTTPAKGEMPAVIQTATNEDGTVLDNMFNMIGDLKLKNVFIVDANALDVVGLGIFSSSSTTPIKLELDSVVCDPCGYNIMIEFGNTPYPKLFVTNSLFLRQGTLDDATTGWFAHLANSASNGFDTVYVENNTFLSTGFGIWQAGKKGVSHFIWINHNSFIFHKLRMHAETDISSFYVTNNLYFDFCSVPFNKTFNTRFPDGKVSGGIQSYLVQVQEDTTDADIIDGQVHSQKKLFCEYNSFYTDPRIQDYITTWAPAHTVNNDGATPIDDSYIQPLMFPPDSAGVNREAFMSTDKAHFPYFFEGNYVDNLFGAGTPDTDPQWTDPKFYDLQDSIVSWTLPATEIYSWGFSANSLEKQPSQAGNWMWNQDTTYNWGNPVVWPRVDASYKNSTLLTASIEGLPLGDLNWFPKAKTLWEENKDAITQHILSEDTTKMILTGVKQDNREIPVNFSLSQNYPNPFNPTTNIKYSITQSGKVTLAIFNILGQKVATLVNEVQKPGNYIVSFDASKLASGVYIYRIQTDNFTQSKKMTLLK